NLLECCSCGHQTSLTAGTVMHGTRKPLQMWFLAMWWICTQKTGGSAKDLQKLLGLGSYQTAWSWLHKLRRAMINADREPLNGTVEIDDAFIGGKEEGVVGRETFKKAKIILAVEVPDVTREALGRLRIGHVRDFSEASLVSFVVDNVSYDSKVITDGWTGYNSLSELGFIHEVHSVAGGAELLENVHLSISLLKRWILGTHHGAVRPKHIQHYLDEFVFRHNRRTSKYVGKIFYRMLQGTIKMKATPYWQLVGREKPDKPLHMVYT
ncbi:IS1595 family transposase, partial [bacterium]|nr:IS1595 family transposase [bacterium]